MSSKKYEAKKPTLEEDEKSKIVKKLLSNLEAQGSEGINPRIRNLLKNANILKNSTQQANFFNVIDFLDSSSIKIIVSPSELQSPMEIASRTIKIKNLSDEKELMKISLAESSKKELNAINIQGISISLHNGCFFIQEAFNQMLACVSKQSFIVQDGQFYLIDRLRYTITPSMNSINVTYEKYIENEQNSSDFEQGHNSWSIRLIEPEENHASGKQAACELVSYNDACKIFRFLHTKHTFNLCESNPLMLTHGMKLKIGSVVLVFDISD